MSLNNSKKQKILNWKLNKADWIVVEYMLEPNISITFEHSIWFWNRKKNVSELDTFREKSFHMVEWWSNDAFTIGRTKELTIEIVINLKGREREKEKNKNAEWKSCYKNEPIDGV